MTTAPVSYLTVNSPLGELLLAETGGALVRIAFEVEGFDSVLGSLAGRIGFAQQSDTPVLRQALRQLSQYFQRSRHTFDLPLDRRLGSSFKLSVQEYLSTIPYGTVVTYRDVATALDNPQAVRAVGSACATNPLPIAVPCHRVIRTDGGLGGYIGGPEIKTWLLDLEKRA